ncbi:MAG: hypothetical protein K2H46_03565 [Muribaculaceae bacterium]|nr:hypothetical protein [Muribaculaceae bacterium]
MKYRFVFILTLCLALMPELFGQAKKPTLIVVPSDPWCTENGYMTLHKDQGADNYVAEYEQAVKTNSDLMNVIIKVQELMSERGFPVKDLGQSIKSIKQGAARDMMTVSRTSGSSLAETPREKLLQTAKADIIIEVYWKVNSTGPKNSVTYSIVGKDPYTEKQVGGAQGTGDPSFSSEVPVLVEEAVIEKMDNFLSQLQAHFDDMAENGREVVVEVKLFDNGSGLTFEEEYNGEELTDIIDDWMAKNTVKGRYNLSDAGETRLKFEQVRIPLYRPNGSAMDTRQFVNQLRKFLQGQPYSLTSKIYTNGLGSAELVIGEK